MTNKELKKIKKNIWEEEQSRVEHMRKMDDMVDAYHGYVEFMRLNPLETRWNKILSFEDAGNRVGGTGRRYNWTEFIEKMETDVEFLDKWKLKKT